ncbi:MAG: rhomboid family intramembrane serine protease [Candidatus Zixiibacteriota bacterium]
MIPLKDDIPSYRPPVVTVALILVNSLTYFYLRSWGAGFEDALVKWGTIPYEVAHGVELTPQAAFPIPLSLLTAMFLHGSFLHLAGNMLFLWIFGDNVEDRLGHVRFFFFYILSGLAASLLYVLSSPNSQVPMVGASGAIAGVLGAYIITFPRARIQTLIFFGFFVRVVAVPALLFLGIWFLFQLLYALPSIRATTGGVAFFAHVGGFLAGIVLFKLFIMFSKRRSYYASCW